MEFATARLRMRLLDTGDGALYEHLVCDAGVMAHVAPVQSVDQARRSFEASCRLNAQMPPERRFWVVHRLGTGRDIGLLGLHWDGDDGAEIGCSLIPEGQAQGIATEAFRALIELAFTRLGLRHLHGRQKDENGIAARLMRRVGFVEAPRRDGDAYPCRWALTADTWAVRPTGD